MNDKQASVAAQVAALPSLTMPEVWALWDRFFQRRPDKTNRVYLESRIAYKLQEEALGGLDPDTRRRLANIGVRHSKIKERSKAREITLAPGTVLVREWGDRDHRVLVTADGTFDYEGQQFKSLSAVARHIADSPWSGPLGAAVSGRASPHRQPDAGTVGHRPRRPEGELARAGLEGADRRVRAGQHRRRADRAGGVMSSHVTLETFVPLVFKRRGIRRLADTGAVAHDPTLIEGVARAIHWQQLLDSGEFESGTAIARAEGLHRSTVNELLRLTLLAPDIVELLMAGRQPRRLTLIWFLRNPIPVDWQQQRQIIQSFE